VKLLLLLLYILYNGAGPLMLVILHCYSE